MNCIVYETEYNGCKYYLKTVECLMHSNTYRGGIFEKMLFVKKITHKYWKLMLIRNMHKYLDEYQLFQLEHCIFVDDDYNIVKVRRFGNDEFSDNHKTKTYNKLANVIKNKWNNDEICELFGHNTYLKYNKDEIMLMYNLFLNAKNNLSSISIQYK